MVESKESISSKIAVRVVASVITVGLLWALSLIPGLLHWLGDMSFAFLSHLKGTSRLPNWSLYIFVFTAIHSLSNMIKRVKKPTGPKVTAYTQDRFLNILWRWSFIGNTPHDPWAFCPHCDTMLVYSQHGGRFDKQIVLICETCGREMLRHEGDRDYLVAKIHRQIDRIIRTGEWTEKIQENHPTNQ